MGDIEDIRRRVKLLTQGDFSFDNFCYIFLWLRETFERRLPTVREIADFLAHPTRDQGLSSDRLGVLIGYLFYQLDRPLDQYDLPQDFPIVARQRLKVLGDRFFEVDRRLTLERCKGLLRSILEQFNQDSSGLYSISDLGLNKLQQKLLSLLLTQQPPPDPLDAAILHFEFRQGLIDGGLLTPEDDDALASAYEPLVLFSLTVMHRCNIRVLNEAYPKHVKDDQYTIINKKGLEETHYRYIRTFQIFLGEKNGKLGIFLEFSMASNNSGAYIVHCPILTTNLAAAKFLQLPHGLQRFHSTSGNFAAVAVRYHEAPHIAAL
ncbi:hypothetical protein [Rhizobium lentis]|uniref:hypothetical protein n=1 Tax=Rhizobium lentis TaxID=1138194 RepID=UPI001A91C509|nr:hypothetical protein [Rhizobium lentis]MBX5064395.1 hypothetical protein [Rhizobium lentis]MBX5076501.1 hypothetical protein [Rhizobium lentis]QSW94095.1 hypothetical protein J0663_02155 [Rhizobium lentis]